jgi:type II secretory pathway component PulJ
MRGPAEGRFEMSIHQAPSPAVQMMATICPYCEVVRQKEQRIAELETTVRVLLNELRKAEMRT